MRNLSLFAPAYTLILYGTNDWVECQGAVPCITIDSLRTIVQTVRDGVRAGAGPHRQRTHRVRGWVQS